MRHGWEYDYPLQAMVTTAHAGSLPAEHSFASVSPDNVVLTAVKKAEDANGLDLPRVRVGREGSDASSSMCRPARPTRPSPISWSSPTATRYAVAGDVVKVPIHPYEILTILVHYPSGGSVVMSMH